MKLRALSNAFLTVLVALGGAAAHDTTTDPPSPAIVVENWRDNFVPFFDAGDPKTRHDSDPTNDDSRENPDTRRRAQRTRDEVKTTGEVGEVGEGCNGGYCLSAGDEHGDYVRFDHLLSVFTKGNGIPPFGGAAVQGRDPNWVSAEGFGTGAKVDFGASRDVTEGTTGRKSVSIGENAANPTITTDTEPEDLASRPPPSQVSFANSADHSWLGLAHSPGDHGPGEFDQHDTHGGTIWADVYLPSEQRPGRVRDSNAGIVILDHLGCSGSFDQVPGVRRPGGCLDEYHTVYADPERTLFQVGEMPGQAESVARDPDRWMLGHQPGPTTPSQIDPTTDPVTDQVFPATDPVVDPAVSSTTGVGQANSPCCAPKPCTAFDGEGNCIDPNAGRFCNRNPAGMAIDSLESQAVVGCVDLPSGDCVGGAITEGGEPQGCVVAGGEIVVSGGAATREGCTIAAVDACCAEGACL